MRALGSGEGFGPVAGTSSASYLGRSPNLASLGNPVRGTGEAEPLLSLRSSNSSYRLEHYKIEQYRIEQYRVQQTMNTCSTPVPPINKCLKGNN